MDFLKRLEQAKALGLTKEEFLPIYMQEMDMNIAKMSSHKVAEERPPAGSAETQQHEYRQQSQQETRQQGAQQLKFEHQQQQQPASQHQQKQEQQHHHHQQQQQQQQQQHPQLTVKSHNQLKASLEQIQSMIRSEYGLLKDENATTRQDLNNAQKEIHVALKELDTKIEGLIQKRQHDDFEQSFTALQDKLQILWTQMELAFEDSTTQVKNGLANTQFEILGEFCEQKQQDQAKQLLHVQRQEELFQQQTAMIQDLVNKLCLQQQQQHFGTLQTMQGLEARAFAKLIELQNLLSIQMQQQERNHQLIYQSTTNLDKQAKENFNLLGILREEHVALQQKIEECHDKALESLQQYEMPGQDEEESESFISDYVEPLHGQMMTMVAKENDFDDLNLQDVDLQDIGQDEFSYLSQELDTLICRNYQMSSTTLIYNFYIKDLSLLVGSRRELQGIMYNRQFGCCLRGNVYFPDDEEPQNVLDICLDMCKINGEVRLPNLLRISTETSLIDQFSSSNDHVIGREMGLFVLPECQKNGWFEASFVTLEYESLLHEGYVKNDAILIQHRITILNRKVDDDRGDWREDTMEKMRSHVSDGSDDEDGEFYDADDYDEDRTPTLMATEKDTEEVITPSLPEEKNNTALLATEKDTQEDNPTLPHEENKTPTILAAEKDTEEDSPPSLHEETKTPISLAAVKDTGEDNPPLLHDEKKELALLATEKNTKEDNPVLLHEEPENLTILAAEKKTEEDILPSLPEEKNSTALLATENYTQEDNPSLLYEKPENPAILAAEKDTEEDYPPLLHEETKTPTSLAAVKDTEEDNPSLLHDEKMNLSLLATEKSTKEDTSALLHEETKTPTSLAAVKDIKKDILPLIDEEKKHPALLATEKETEEELPPLLHEEPKTPTSLAAEKEIKEDIHPLIDEEKKNLILLATTKKDTQEDNPPLLREELENPTLLATEKDTKEDILPLIYEENTNLALLATEEETEEIPPLLTPHRTYYFRIENLASLRGSGTLIDSEDWYLRFLGHSIRAVLIFVESNSFMICLDYFHGNCDDNLPELALLKCLVHVVDPTDRMEEKLLGEWEGFFDMTREQPPDWLENCVCSVDCDSLARERYVLHDEILLRFDFFEM